MQGLPNTTASRGRATCPRGHSWKAIRVSSWKWNTPDESGRGATKKHEQQRRPVEVITFAPADCPSCGQVPRTFRRES